MVKNVSFSEDQEGLFKELKDKGFVSKKFSMFVKDAFYDKIDEVRAKRIPLAQDVLEKVAQAHIIKISKEAAQ